MAATLTQEQVANARNAQRLLTDAIQDVLKLEKCGENCEHFKQSIESIMNKLQALLDNFSTPGT